MEYNNLDPLYKILCLALIFLVPLAPAYGLYKIAPDDKFLAKGNFSGFKINATGSAAIYIVLFVAIYYHTGPILKGIDTSRGLTNKIIQLVKDRPWKVQYQLKLMIDSVHEIDPAQYARFVQIDSIICVPRAMNLTNDDKIIQFYLDNDDMDKMGDTIKSQVTFRNGYGTCALPVAKKSTYVNQKDRIITITSKIYKAQPKISQLSEINNHSNTTTVLNRNDGNTAPPKVTGQQ
jgi:hypothetical protein